MIAWKCPVCGDTLRDCRGSWRCSAGHSFDTSKYGYVNLLMSNKSSKKRHGDDRAMVLARSAFLEKGYYSCLRDCLCRTALEYSGKSADILDAGCGEGWYSAGVRSCLEERGVCVSMAGIDISREALRVSSRRGGMQLAVSGVSALPVGDGSCDIVMNIFAPHDDGEFLRVLRRGGVLIKAAPLERHLFGLKRAVYDEPYENPAPDYCPEGFEMLAREEVRAQLHLASPEDIRALFMMTPYYYKTSERDQQKLFSLEALDTELEFAVIVLKKR